MHDQVFEVGKRNELMYINGMKGIACLFIMISHFLGIYKYAQEFSPKFPILDIILNSPISFLVNETYWLYLFFVVSGYLVAKSKIVSVKDFMFKLITRFLRFVFPILFSYLFIYLPVGFHSSETNNFFLCDWFQKSYTSQYQFIEVILSPVRVLIFGKCDLNSPYWCLKYMFFSSVIIYLCKMLYFFYMTITMSYHFLCL